MNLGLTFQAEFDPLQDYCPKCNSKNLERGWTETTLMGWIGGPENNPNRHRRIIRCLDCNLKYVLTWRIRHKEASISILGDENVKDQITIG